MEKRASFNCIKLYSLILLQMNPLLWIIFHINQQNKKQTSLQENVLANNSIFYGILFTKLKTCQRHFLCASFNSVLCSRNKIGGINISSLCLHL